MPPMSFQSLRRTGRVLLSWIRLSQICGTTVGRGHHSRLLTANFSSYEAWPSSGFALQSGLVDSQPCAVDMHRLPSKRSCLGDGEAGGLFEYPRSVTPESVSWLCEQEQLSKAVEALGVLAQAGTGLSKPLLYAVLRQCVIKKDLVLGRHVHAVAVKVGYESDTFLCNHILRMYSSHASLQEAMNVFTVVAEPDAFLWSSILSAHVKHGQTKQAIQLYHQMRRSKVKPDAHVFVAALQACARGADLTTGKQVHADVVASGVKPDFFVSCSLVDMYAKCGNLETSQRIFDGLGRKTVVTWNAMIAGYARRGFGLEALRLYASMREEGITAPDSVTFVCLLQACANVGFPALEKGKQLHAQLHERGLHADVVVGCSLVNMYAKCGSLQDAEALFDRLPQKNVVTWNAMMSGFSQQGMGQEALRLYEAMLVEGITAPDSVTFVCVLQACGHLGTLSLEKGKQIHLQLGEKGLDTDQSVVTSLVNMYAKCGSLQDARAVFDGLCQKTVVTWNTMIGGYSQQGMSQEAFHIYSAMLEEGITSPDSVTFICLLQACACVGMPGLETGKQLHAQIKEQGLQGDVCVANNLINMYAKCGSVLDAQGVFDESSEKTDVTWNALIGGYSQQGRGQEALLLYRAMQEEGVVEPNYVTFVCLLQACASLGPQALKIGKQLHAHIQEQGLENVVVGSSLVNMYGKCGSLEDARNMFDKLGAKDAVTWTALISAYSQQGMDQEALHLFNAMQEKSISAPDSVTFVCLLQACANVAALYPGRQLHAEIKAQGLQADVSVAISLINMYAKSGSMVEAQHVFDALPKRDVIAWNALIAGYSRQGDSEVVLDLVHQMQEDGIHPDGVTFVSILTVCSHAGLVCKGKEIFASMRRQYGIACSLEHYTCMVDLLGRAGHLDEALAVIRTMSVLPHAAVWHTLLGACRKWNNVEVGRHAFNEVVKLDEKHTPAYVLMANIYTSVQMLEEAQEMQARRIVVGAWKQPGRSWWTDMNGLVHSFLVGDKNHAESDGIYAKLKQLALNMKK